MARYFFSVRAGDRLHRDPDGVDLPADADLGACASYYAARLRDGGVIDGASVPDCRVEVADGEGRLVLTVPVPSQSA